MVLLRPSRLKLISLVMVPSSDLMHMKDLELSLYLVSQITNYSSITLDLVTSSTLVVLQKQLPSIQTRSKCSSPSLERDLQKRELPEKSVRVELSPSLVLLEIHLSHLQSNQLFLQRSAARYSSLLTALLLVLVPLCILWWCRSSWCSSTNRASTIQGCWRFREQKICSICWIWFSQKTIWCCRVCLVQPRRRQMLFSFTGERISEKRTSREISQGGTLKVSGESNVLLTLAHQGEGTIPVTGDTKFTRARDFVGFGTLRKLSGAAESLTFNPTERDMLFSFTGERIAERTTFRELGTAGKFTFTGTSGDPLLTFAEQPFVNIDVTGDSVDIRSRISEYRNPICNQQC